MRLETFSPAVVDRGFRGSEGTLRPIFPLFP